MVYYNILGIFIIRGVGGFIIRGRGLSKLGRMKSCLLACSSKTLEPAPMKNLQLNNLSRAKVRILHMGSPPNYGPSLVSLDIRCRNIM